MTVEEAIKCIDDVLDSDVHWDESIDYKLMSIDVDWLGKSKEALEKQIPKKPLYHKEEQREGYTYLKQEFYKCPSCNEILYIQNHKERTYPGCRELNRYPQGNRTNHCCYCGQALDWSDAE